MKDSVFLILVVFLFTVFSCDTNRKPENIAIINGSYVSIDEVDSIASESIYKIRKDVLKTIIKRSVIEQEAKKRDVSIEELITLEVKNKAHKISDSDYKRYLDSYNLEKKDINRVQANLYLKKLKEKERYEDYADSLIRLSDLKIFLHPYNYRKIKLNGVKYFDLTPNNSVNVVYIISDYDCPNCRFIEPKLESLIKNYSKTVNFRYVYFSDFVSVKALAISALAQQVNISEMHSYFYKCSVDLNREDINKFVETLDNIDLEQFYSDMDNPETMIELLKTKDKLIQSKIYSTPTFIVNTILLDDEFAIYRIENLLKQ
jgi:thiol-disulfide isomerase/thioredoxin